MDKSIFTSQNFIVFLLATFLIGSCSEPKPSKPNEGMWLAKLETIDGQKLPFNFSLKKISDNAYQLEIFNASETIVLDEIEIRNDSIYIRPPVFEGYIVAKFSDTAMRGSFIKESLNRIVPFEATFGSNERFIQNGIPTENISGQWEVEFNPNSEDSYPAKGIFMQEGAKVTGTFRTTTGDYRYLEGVMNGDSLKLSTFDGAHAFLFSAQASDSTLNGLFYSGNHSKETFVGRRNEIYELPSEDSLTFLKEGYEKLEFSFPNENGVEISLEDSRFKNKVVIVQIMGTWCPNCLDETKFLIDYLNKNPEIEIIALAFEYARTEDGAFKSIKRLKDRLGVPYPILLAQYGTSDKSKAQEKLPMLNHILSYPTTIFIDKEGKVRKIHTGFNGPATEEKYQIFKQEFDNFVKELSRE